MKRWSELGPNLERLAFPSWGQYLGWCDREKIALHASLLPNQIIFVLTFGYLWWLYFNISRTEKYIIAICGTCTATCRSQAWVIISTSPLRRPTGLSLTYQGGLFVIFLLRLLTIIIIIITRSSLAFGRRGLEWIIGPKHSLDGGYIWGCLNVSLGASGATSIQTQRHTTQESEDKLNAKNKQTDTYLENVGIKRYKHTSS